MKIDIEVQELEGILNGEYRAIHKMFFKDTTLAGNFDKALEQGEGLERERVRNWLDTIGISYTCKHGREMWNCYECLK